ncbi:MAG: hypothetical protein LAO07_00480 [Acidobacteriia bacterium]|nr:hypothetical protein [Terriglobia bacterium]
MSSNDDKIFGYAALGFGLGLYWFIKGFRMYRKYRVLADTPEVPIRSVAMGLVEIHGKATGEEQIYSPVGNTPCYFYKVEIEKYMKDSKGRGRWTHAATDLNGLRFYLADASGKVLVDLHDAEFDLPENCKRETERGAGLGFTSIFGASQRNNPALGIGPTDQDLLDYVARVGSGMVIPNLVSSSPPTFPAGGATSSTPTPESRDVAQRELELFRQQMRAGRSGQSFSSGLGGVFNFFRGAGLSRTAVHSTRLRLTEFCVVPDRWYDLTGTCAENPNPRDENDRNLIVKGENEPTFLISWRTEKDIEGHLRWRSLQYIFGGGILSVICLAVMLFKLGWL